MSIAHNHLAELAPERLPLGSPTLALSFASHSIAHPHNLTCVTTALKQPSPTLPPLQQALLRHHLHYFPQPDPLQPATTTALLTENTNLKSEK